ncbi:aldehyde dehydrogenase family protein [Actinomadura sp. NAK00032]|uniref:aldehyde dehydrogenase family protein n=1 Tax=Actinomadura sp. NAK00032 TaxID=2742128 RepID=UPI001C37AC5E|nr:aldehyde dehydrogenase family protein [Actinomadura sp. NAK00032]
MAAPGRTARPAGRAVRYAQLPRSSGHVSAPRLGEATTWPRLNSPARTYRKTNYVAPFGGFKDSGLGRENGLEAINDYTEVKTAWIDMGNQIKDPFNPRA